MPRAKCEHKHVHAETVAVCDDCGRDLTPKDKRPERASAALLAEVFAVEQEDTP